MKNLRVILLSASVLALGACETVGGAIDSMGNMVTASAVTDDSKMADKLVTKGSCPSAEIVQELSGYSDFANTQYLAEDELVSRAHISGINSKCEYSQRSVTIDLALTLEGTIGPKGRGNNSYTYPFFVAITSPSGKILAKEVFSATMDFKGKDYLKYNETLRQIIPLSDSEDGDDHNVLVGFQLGPEQLDYNRKILMQTQEAQKAAQEQAEAPVEAEATTGAPQPLTDKIIIERTAP